MSNQSVSCLRSGVVAAVLTISRVLEAQPSMLIDLEYHGSRTCPDDASFMDRVRARTERVEFAVGQAPSTTKLVVTLNADVLEGAIDLRRSNAGPLIRSARGATCEEVADALAAIVAEAMDPALPPRPAPASATQGGAGAGASPGEGPAVAPASGSSPSERGRSRAGEGDTDSEPATWQLTLGAGPVLAGGMAPNPSFGVLALLRAVVATKELLGPSLVVSVEYAMSPTARVDVGDATFTRALIRVEASPWGLRPHTTIAVMPCVAFEAGSLWVASENSAGTSERRSAPWQSAGLGARLDWQASRRTIVSLGGLAMHPLRRHTFQFGEPSASFEVYRVPNWALGGTLAVAAAFW
jgi:hypothetical protein